ncbi:MAG: CRISPR-associated endonuclease Cas2, partial [Desulfatirhabdiaceae bacterium]|nr:CRISPR-associated endonuclease Cas2 [Desulfatirhabdiaceae bacterium]
MKDEEHLYIISYDIRDHKRWKKIYKTLKGFGEWLQLSVFQCRLGKMSALRLEAALSEIMNQNEDHVLIMDIGPAENVKPKV